MPFQLIQVSVASFFSFAGDPLPRQPDATRIGQTHRYLNASRFTCSSVGKLLKLRRIAELLTRR
jgi:hypothetical protein